MENAEDKGGYLQLIKVVIFLGNCLIIYTAEAYFCRSDCVICNPARPCICMTLILFPGSYRFPAPRSLACMGTITNKSIFCQSPLQGVRSFGGKGKHIQVRFPPCGLLSRITVVLSSPEQPRRAKLSRTDAWGTRGPVMRLAYSPAQRIQ